MPRIFRRRSLPESVAGGGGIGGGLDRPNEPTGMNLITQNNFDSTILETGWTGEANYTNFYTIENVGGTSRDGSPYLRLSIPAGHPQGQGFPNLSFDFSASHYNEIYYRYWLRGSPIAQFNSNVQKVLHFWGPSGAGGGISNVGLCNLFIGSSGYNCRAAFQNIESANLGGGGGTSNQVTGGSFTFNNWVRIEGYLRYNSIDTAGGADGFHRIWRYNPTSGFTAQVFAENLFWTQDVAVASRYWRSVDIDPTLPGATSGGVDAPADYDLFFDDFYVSGRAA